MKPYTLPRLAEETLRKLSLDKQTSTHRILAGQPSQRLLSLVADATEQHVRGSPRAWLFVVQQGHGSQESWLVLGLKITPMQSCRMRLPWWFGLSGSRQ